MEGRQRRSFTDDYKRQAVDLVASSGRSVGSVAKELGLRDSALRRWSSNVGPGWSRRRRRGAPQRRRRCRRRTTRRRSFVCSERTSDCAWSVTFKKADRDLCWSSEMRFRPESLRSASSKIAAPTIQ